MNTRTLVELQKTFLSYIQNIGFTNLASPTGKFYSSKEYPSIKVWICFVPCRTGVVLLTQRNKQLYADPMGNMKKFKKELAKYKKNE